MLSELAEKLSTTPLGIQLVDVHARRERLWHRLAGHRDPLLREIGEQLREDRLRPADLLRHPHYQAVLTAGADRLATLDAQTLHAEIDRYVAAHYKQEHRPVHDQAGRPIRSGG